MYSSDTTVKKNNFTESENKNDVYAKISKVHNIESESVFKRNRLMLEHVMLERAMKKLNNRKDRKEAEKLKANKEGGTTNDWKIR